MRSNSKCAECGRTITTPALDGRCPRCLLHLALGASTGPLTSSLNEQQTEMSEAPEALDAPSLQFGNYQLIEKIGQGAMGAVFKSRQIPLNRVVAVKVLLSGSLATEPEVRRFRKEAEAAATLKHPGIVAIHEVADHEGRPFFSMDYIEGQSLAKVIQRTPLPPPRAARYLKSIAEAIHYAHGRGILHRDLKPANVLIDPNDQPHITDFGLAKQIEVESDLTLTGVVLGTPSYMPPEQAAGRKHKIGPASDVYALGAILYDMLTGRPPFRADTVVDTLRQVLDNEPVSPRLLNPKVPRDLETICLKCLAKEPSARYNSAQALAEDLQRFLNDEPIIARPLSPLARSARWCRRHPAIAWPFATLILLLASTTIAALLFAKSLESKLKSQILMGNLFTAQQAARSVLLQLQEWSDVVAAEAANPALRQLLKAKNRSPRDFQLLMEQLRDQHSNAGTLTNTFQSWYVETATGVLLGAAPLINSKIIGNKYDGRDYFKGALLHQSLPGRASVHVSKAFKADNDDYYKFALSAAVRDGDTPDAPLLGIIAATVAAGPSLGSVHLNDQRSKAVFVGRLDHNPPSGPPNPADPSEYLILFHPDYEGVGKQKFPVRNRALPAVHHPVCGPDELTLSSRSQSVFDEKAVDANYIDPCSPGKWLAAFAPVGGTEGVIIVQTPFAEVSQLNRQLFYYLSVSSGGVIGFAAAAAGITALFSILRPNKD